MRPNYRLASLDVSSMHEAPAVPLTLPGKIETGVDSALAILEGGFRSPTLACRFTYPIGLVGIRLPQGSLPEVLQVNLQLRMDRTADERWATRVVGIEERKASLGIPSLRNTDPSGRHRLVAVWVQGRLRGAALLAEGPDGKVLPQRLILDLPSRELDASRLLLLSFTTGTAAWDHPHELDEPLVGVSLPWVEVGQPDEALSATVSTGTPAERGGRRYSPGIGFAVVNPVSPDDPVRVEVRRVAAANSSRRLLGRRSRPEADTGLTVEAVDARGRALPAPAVARVAPERFELVLPAQGGPVQLRLVLPEESPGSRQAMYTLRGLPRR